MQNVIFKLFFEIHFVGIMFDIITFRDTYSSTTIEKMSLIGTIEVGAASEVGVASVEGSGDVSVGEGHTVAEEVGGTTHEETETKMVSWLFSSEISSWISNTGRSCYSGGHYWDYYHGALS